MVLVAICCLVGGGLCVWSLLPDETESDTPFAAIARAPQPPLFETGERSTTSEPVLERDFGPGKNTAARNQTDSHSVLTTPEGGVLSGAQNTSSHDQEAAGASVPSNLSAASKQASVQPQASDTVISSRISSGVTEKTAEASVGTTPRMGAGQSRPSRSEAPSDGPHHDARPMSAAPSEGDLEPEPAEGSAAVPGVSPESAPDPAPAPDAPVGDTGRPEEIGRPVVDFVIGGSHPDPRRRMVGWNLLTEGWAAFIRKRVNPYLEIGVTRIILHNPFGILPDESMQLDQYLTALEQPGLRMLTGGFIEAWKPVTARGIEVIAYVGCPRLDKDATRIDEEGGRAAGLAFSLSCLQPALDAGMSIGLDAAAPADGNSLTWDLAKHLKNQGVKVYVEARPYAEMSHWFDFPVICIDHFWRRSDPERHADALGAANGLLTGEILRMVVQYKVPAEWEGTEGGYVESLSRTVQQHGHTPIVLAGSKFPPEWVAELMSAPASPAYD